MKFLQKILHLTLIVSIFLAPMDFTWAMEKECPEGDLPPSLHKRQRTHDGDGSDEKEKEKENELSSGTSSEEEVEEEDTANHRYESIFDDAEYLGYDTKDSLLSILQHYKNTQLSEEDISTISKEFMLVLEDLKSTRLKGKLPQDLEALRRELSAAYQKAEATDIQPTIVSVKFHPSLKRMDDQFFLELEVPLWKRAIQCTVGFVGLGATFALEAFIRFEFGDRLGVEDSETNSNIAITTITLVLAPFVGRQFYELGGRIAKTIESIYKSIKTRVETKSCKKFFRLPEISSGLVAKIVATGGVALFAILYDLYFIFDVENVDDPSTDSGNSYFTEFTCWQLVIFFLDTYLGPNFKLVDHIESKNRFSRTGWGKKGTLNQRLDDMSHLIKKREAKGLINIICEVIDKKRNQLATKYSFRNHPAETYHIDSIVPDCDETEGLIPRDNGLIRISVLIPAPAERTVIDSNLARNQLDVNTDDQSMRFIADLHEEALQAIQGEKITKNSLEDIDNSHRSSFMHSLLGVLGTSIAGVRSVPQYLIIKHMITVASESISFDLPEEGIIALSALITLTKTAAEVNITKSWYQRFSPLFSFDWVKGLYGVACKILKKATSGEKKEALLTLLGHTIAGCGTAIKELASGASATILTLIEFGIAGYAFSDVNLNDDLEIFFYIFNTAGTFAVFDTLFLEKWENLMIGIKTSWPMDRLKCYKRNIVLYYIKRFQEALRHRLTPKEVDELYRATQGAS